MDAFEPVAAALSAACARSSRRWVWTAISNHPATAGSAASKYPDHLLLSKNRARQFDHEVVKAVFDRAPWLASTLQAAISFAAI